MNYLFRKLVEKKRFFLLNILCRIFWNYIEKQRKSTIIHFYKCPFKKGDKVKLNWKYIVSFSRGDKDEIIRWYTPDVLTFDYCDENGVCYTEEGETYSYYWLCKD